MVDTQAASVQVGPQAADEIARLFPPLGDIRAVLNLALPIALAAMVTGFAWVNDWTSLTRMAGLAAGLLTLASWVFFMRVMTAKTVLPDNLPEYRAGWSPPLRFQPEIPWHAVMITLRSVIGVPVVLLGTAIIGYFIGGPAAGWDLFTTMAPYYLLLGPPILIMIIPPFALLNSRIGVRARLRQTHDFFLPKSVIRRRNAALESLQAKWPDAVPEAG